MPRTRRASASDTTAAEPLVDGSLEAQPETPATASDATNVAEARRPRRPAAPAQVEEAPTNPPFGDTHNAENADSVNQGKSRRPPRKASKPIPPPANLFDGHGESGTPQTATDAMQQDGSQPAAERSQRGRRRSSRRRIDGAVEPTATPVESSSVSKTTKSTNARGGRKRNPGEKQIQPTGSTPVKSLLASDQSLHFADTSAPTSGSDTVKRKPGGRRSLTTLPVVTDQTVTSLDIATPVAPIDDPSSDKTAVTGPSRRGRSRRHREGVAAKEIVTTDTVNEVVDVELAKDDVGVSEDDNGKKTRRSRRGGRRRRGGNGEGVEITEPTTVLIDPSEDVDDLQDVEEEEEEEDLFVELTPAPTPLYVAPRFVPTLTETDAPEMRISATLAVRPRGGIPNVQINGQDFPPLTFFVNTEAATDGAVVDNQIQLAAKAGIHLFSGVMYLPLKNAYGDRSFGKIDALLQQIIAADPDAYIIPRLQFVPTNYWVRTHEDQMATYADGGEGDNSIASTDFWIDCLDALRALVEHLADPRTVGGDRVAGIHLDRGEWFYDATIGPDLSPANQSAFRNWLQEKYQLVYALRAAWHDATVTFETVEIPKPEKLDNSFKAGVSPLFGTPRERRWADYALFQSDTVAEVLTGLANAVKTLTNNRLLVSVSYGYTLEFATRNDSGHLSLRKVLECPDIDILAGPNSYAGRSAGNPGCFGALIDSVALHNKLWVVEDDTKTFLADAPTDDTYNAKILSGSDTQAVHQRHFGAALAHRTGITWMDLWGQGWLNNADVWHEFERLRDTVRCWHAISQHESNQDLSEHGRVIVFVDECSLAFMQSDPAGLGFNLITKTRDLLVRSGAAIEFYLQSDVLNERLPDAKLYLFLNALRITSPERQAIREKLQRPGKTLAWLYAAGIFDENGAASVDVADVTGIATRLQPWNARLGSQLTEIRNPITERLRNGKKIGQEEIVNPSFTIVDQQASALAEYTATGAPSMAVREHTGGWKSVYFADPHLTIELLRGLFAYADVPVHDTQDDVVYAAGDGVLSVHAPFTGQRTLTLPRRATVYDVFADKIVGVNVTSFRAFLRARTTSLYLWGPSEAIAYATGLELAGSVSEPDVEITEVEISPLPIVQPVPQQSEDADEMQTFLSTLSDKLPETEDGLAGPTGESEEESAPAPRSRWQRRRAAARARRDAERKAEAEAAGNGQGDPASMANVSIETVLPGLPPRRPRPPAEGESRPKDS